MMQRTTWNTQDIEALTAAFNTVYTGYLVPLQFRVDQMQLHISANGISREHSPLWLDETGQVVAVAALAVRGDRGWIGGFGIAPGARGRRLSHQLLAEVLATVRRLGLRQVQLEVLQHNVTAIHVYEQSGFVRTRDLRYLTWERDHAQALPEPSEIVPVEIPQLLPHLARINRIHPCWQREPASLDATGQLQGFVVGSPIAPAAFAVCLATGADLRIYDIGVADVALIPALVSALEQHFGPRRMVLSNEPAESAMSWALEQQGWRELLRQHEMVYHLSADAA